MSTMAQGEGSTFGKYILLKRLAIGGMGEIYLAKLTGPEGFEKMLVIKRMLSHHTENQRYVDMFFAEARVAAQLNHSSIVQIYDMGQIGDVYYIAMEYVHGKSLKEVIDHAKAIDSVIPAPLVVEMISRLCDALGYAHEAKDMGGDSLAIVHRDINPYNFLVSYSGESKVIDFGIAKSEMSTHKTETGTIKGKFVYMSPEQSAALELDARSDIFSIGICLYEALTYRNPFAKGNAVLSLDAIQRHDPPPLAEFKPEYAVFQDIADRALAKNRDDRFSSCREFGDALRALLDDGVLERHPASLQDYMNDIFREQIIEEKRMILATDSATTRELGRMRQAEELSRGLSLDATVSESDAHLLLGKVAAASDVVGLEDTGILTEPMFGSDAERTIFKNSRDPEIGPESDATEYEHELLGSSKSGHLLIACCLLFVLAAGGWMVMDSSEEEAPLPTLVVTPVPPPKAEEAKPEVTETAPVAMPTPEAELKPKPAPQPAAQAVEEKPVVSTAAPKTKPARTSKPKPKPKPKAAVGYGNLQISTTPPVPIHLNGRAVGQTFKLKKTSGTMTFGSGDDRQSNPFKVTVRYRVEDGKISFSVNSVPWAIVRGAQGIGLGRTPLDYQEPGKRAVFELLNPKGLHQRITFRFISR
jgi:serine/threonine protein kinase